MTRPGVTCGVLAAVWWAAGPLLSAGGTDPFGFLAPDVVIGATDRARLDANEPVVRVLPSRDGFLSLSAIIRVHATADRLAAWAQDVEALQKGRYVPQIGRFSSPPRLDDLAGLTIDPEELDDLRGCRPGDCQVKLSDLEIAQVRAAGTRSAADLAFRRVLVQRAADYLRDGDACALPYHDHRTPIRSADVFSAMLARTPFFQTHLTCYADYLRNYPGVSSGPVRESFLYWSKETLGMKPIISITHHTIGRFGTPGLPAVASVAKQVYASHYKDASFTVTALTGHGQAHYLVYLHRSHVDAFRGLFGGIVRRTVERRVKAEAPAVLRTFRDRLESGDPPDRRADPGSVRR